MDYAGLIIRLEKLDTCAVSDALDALCIAGVAQGITRCSTRQMVAGRVRTMKLAAGEAAHDCAAHLGTRSVEEASDMDIIVVEQKTGIAAACWGGVLSEAAHHKHIRGIVVEGAVRDVDEINAIGLPVFSRAILPASARGRIHEAAVNAPIEVADVTVMPGDLVIADGTGVVFIPATSAAAVIAKAECIVLRERQMIEAVHENKPITDIMGRDYESMLDKQA